MYHEVPPQELDSLFSTGLNTWWTVLQEQFLQIWDQMKTPCMEISLLLMDRANKTNQVEGMLSKLTDKMGFVYPTRLIS